MVPPAQLARAVAGAIVYAPGAPAEAALADFANTLKSRGWRVGGLLQRTLRNAEGRKLDMELIAVDTGEAISIGQPLGSGAAGDACAVDPGAMAEASAALRRAIAAKVDLLVVNKFSFYEREGGGFAQELLAAMAEGIPVLTSVPAALMEDWWRFCGGRTHLLAADPAALWRWWGARRLYQDLAQGVGEGVARRIVIGLNWTLVEGPDGVGLAQSPNRDTPGCYGKLDAGAYAGRPLRALAGMIDGWNPFERAIAMAAVNAHHNRFDLGGEDANGLDMVDGQGRTVVVGSFPKVQERLPGCFVVERAPDAGEYPEQAADWLIPGADAVVATGSTLGNGSLPRLLELALGAQVVLVGPSVTLSPRLFDHGVSVLSGFVAEDVDGLVRCVGEGGAGGAVKRYGRQVSLRR